MATDSGWGEANRQGLDLLKEATGFELAKPFSNKILCKKKLGVRDWEICLDSLNQDKRTRKPLLFNEKQPATNRRDWLS